MQKKTITADLDMEVTSSEATELCIHHLKLAFGFYLSSEGRLPEENRVNLLAEVKRQCTDRNMTDWGLNAITAFVETAVAGDEGPDA